MNKTAVIVGGGLGGLFTAAILSKEGVKVNVLEKNLNLGGGLQSFKRFGEVYDAGMHILSGMHEGGSIRKICNYLGLTDKMHIRPVDDDCIDELHFVEDGSTYRIGKGREGFIESLVKHFPDQREALTKYVDAMYALLDEMDMFHLRPLKTNLFMHSADFLISTGDFIAKYIKDEKLRSVLAYMNPLYGGEKDKTPAYIHSIINVLYINGGNRFEGGCDLFVNELRKLIEDNGGTVIVNDGVVSVSSEDKLITGVKTKSGKLFTADYYISAIHPCTFIKLLEDKKILSKPYRERLEAIPNSYSAFTLFVKLKPNMVKYFNYTRYCMTRYDEIWNIGVADEQWPRGVMYMTTPEINQGEYSTKMIITTPMSWEFVKKWENTTVGHRGEDYKAWKQECAKKLLDRIEKIHPGFIDSVEAINTASPLTIRDYFGIKEGSMYGFMSDCNNIVLSQVPVVTKVKNLYLTGQNNNLHGFCGVPLTAINTCEAIFGMNYIINKINAANP